ncbi:lipopolysaccharide biosynthesis protein [Bradyrhizobium sp.]|uniref:lipopolysaccharide biosynthesis protein n=1 Tax=Bradyrhizobium sp. TaxID=376 RepID=UPI0025C2C508|nr:lipopolysaccharide biosynthesis protein [Bradyrhizobium sp.]
MRDDQLQSFRIAASNGMAFTALGQGLKLFVHMAAIVLLSRLLGPSNFGIFAMLSPILALATILRDAGVNGAILQRSTVSYEELSTLFWLHVSWGCVLAVILGLSAPFIALFYAEPRLIPLVIASTFIVVAGSLSLQHMALLNRDLRFRALAFIDAGSLALGYVVGTITALLTGSYWALVAAAGTTTVTVVVSSWAVCRWRPGWPSTPNNVSDILRVGGNITLSGLFDFLIRSVDNVLIGRARGPFELGLYDRAYRIVLLPLVFVSAPMDRLVLPLLVRMRNEQERYRKIYRLAVQAPLLAILPSMVTIMAIPEPVCLLLLGPEWKQAAPLLGWLSLAGALQLVTSSLGALLISQERARELTLLNAFSFVFACAAYAIGLPYGAWGVAACYAVSEVIRAPLAVYWTTRRGWVRPSDIAEAVLPFVAAGVSAFAAISLLKHQLPGAPVTLIGLSAFISYAITLALLACTRSGRQCLNEASDVAERFRTFLWSPDGGGWLRRQVSRR